MDSTHTVLWLSTRTVERDNLLQKLTRRGLQGVLPDAGKSLSELIESLGIDLVVLDDSYGFEALEHLRLHYDSTQLPVVVVLAETGADMLGALDRGANDYVTRPVDPELLLMRMRVYLKAKRVAVARPSKPAPPSPSLRSVSESEAPSPGRTSSPASVEDTHPAVGQEESLGFSAVQNLGPGMVLDGRYRLETVLGSGGFGSVYRAQHLVLQTPVAVKLLHPQLAHSPAVLKRFQLEGLTGFRVRHPHAVTMLDASLSGSMAYLVMEYLEGCTLQEALEVHGPFSLARCAQVLPPVCEALEAAHLTGIVHRDIKPANIFLAKTVQGEVVKVLDFGIAKITEQDGQPKLTTSEGFPGTLLYMAPERLAGDAADGHADVYSLGVTLYELLSGEFPFGPPASNPIAQAMRQLQESPRDLRGLIPDLPDAVNALVGAMLARKPDARPALGDVAGVLRRYLDHPSPARVLPEKDKARERPEVEPSTARGVPAPRTVLLSPEEMGKEDPAETDRDGPEL